VREFIFLGVEDVLFLHADTIGIRRGLARSESPWVVGRSSCDASSAVWWQVSTWGPHCHGRRLSLHIAQNHPFIDGNKRVAVMAALVFLHVNGIEKLPAPEALEITTRQVAAGELSKDALTQWLRAQIGKRK